jgi:hypothetical protein
MKRRNVCIDDYTSTHKNLQITVVVLQPRAETVLSDALTRLFLVGLITISFSGYFKEGHYCKLSNENAALLPPDQEEPYGLLLKT